ncbi:type IV toxin-antitoxin system AbiEi family antitoxin domain-containing protein [soil metagenome]
MSGRAGRYQTRPNRRWNRVDLSNVERYVLDEYLRQHDGVITLAQAQAAGLDKHAVSRRVRSGHWRRCAPGVYFVDDRPFSTAARIRATVWSYGPQAAASGLAAAWWHELISVGPAIVEVTVPRDSNGRKHPQSKVRRRDLKPSDVIELRGLRITSLDLTTIEAAVRRGGSASIMDTALQRHTELPALWRAHMRNTGRYGSPAARLLLQAARDGARSPGERILIQLLKNAGITGWKTNYPVGGYKVDVAFPGKKVAIETDGFAFHSDPDAFRKDRIRQNRITLLGWTVLRFTWQDLIEHPERVIAEIQRAIRA